jgi:hypothetical protein
MVQWRSTVAQVHLSSDSSAVFTKQEMMASKGSDLVFDPLDPGLPTSCQRRCPSCAGTFGCTAPTPLGHHAPGSKKMICHILDIDRTHYSQVKRWEGKCARLFDSCHPARRAYNPIYWLFGTATPRALSRPAC